MAASNLTSLANAKAWLGNTTTNDDALVTRLIASASRFIYSYLNRSTFFQKAYSEVYDGVGQRAQVLRNYPVLSVGGVQIGSCVISASPGYPQCGYLFDAWDGSPPGQPQTISLQGHRFPYSAPQSISISYTAGFVVQNEPQTVPSSGYQITPDAPYGSWGADQGVTYANGTALLAVPANPAAGQYVAPTAANAFYQFSAADANAAVLITYSYIPADIEQACIEIVAERYKYRNRIGEMSKSLGGQETMSYSQKDMSDYVKGLLSPYRRVVPV